jgi:beta-lactamase class C
MIGHRGGINGYRSLILFDPQRKSGVVALWNSNTNQPGAVEFEVMDMVYHLPFRDWLELNSQPSAKAPQIASNQEETDGSGDSAPVRRHSGR